MISLDMSSQKMDEWLPCMASCQGNAPKTTVEDLVPRGCYSCETPASADEGEDVGLPCAGGVTCADLGTRTAGLPSAPLEEPVTRSLTAGVVPGEVRTQKLVREC